MTQNKDQVDSANYKVSKAEKEKMSFNLSIYQRSNSYFVSRDFRNESEHNADGAQKHTQPLKLMKSVCTKKVQCFLEIYQNKTII